MSVNRTKLVSESLRLANVSSWADIRLPLPVVPLALFFEGNDDLSSIGCNLSPHPGISTFFAVLSAVKKRDDVQDVIVEINEIVDQENVWPFSERIYILTVADPVFVEEDWLREIQPSVVARVSRQEVADTPGMPAGIGEVISAWWD